LYTAAQLSGVDVMVQDGWMTITEMLLRDFVSGEAKAEEVNDPRPKWVKMEREAQVQSTETGVGHRERVAVAAEG